MVDHIIVFDTETDGTDPLTANIITCYASVYNREMKVIDERHWIIDHGIEIPEEASKVNGLTTEWVRENGRKDVRAALLEISSFLYEYSYLPMSAYNCSYDFTALLMNSERAECPAFIPIIEGFADSAIVVDPLVLDRAKDRYRKGSRKLVDVARHYGITVDESKLHEASYDVFLTAQLVWKFLDMWKAPLDQIVEYQKEAHKKWAINLEGYLRSHGEPDAVVQKEWPVILKGESNA